MSDPTSINPNVLWIDPAGRLPALIRTDNRGNGIDRRGQDQRKTRAVVLSEAMDGAFQLIEDGELDLPGTLARLLALDAELEALEAKAGAAHQLADAVSVLAAEGIAANLRSVNFLRERLDRLEAEHYHFCAFCGSEEHDSDEHAELEALGKLEDDDQEGADDELAPRFQVGDGAPAPEPWTIAGGGDGDQRRKRPVVVPPVQSKGTEREPNRTSGGAQVERRITERRMEPYRCQVDGCGSPLEARGHAGLGARIYVCTGEDCGRMDSRRNPSNERRGAQLVRCALHVDGACSRKTSNPMWSGWRWARTNTEDPGRGAWLCPDDRDGSIPGEIQRCGVCTTWTPVENLVEGTAADGSAAPVCKGCGLEAGS